MKLTTLGILFTLLTQPAFASPTVTAPSAPQPSSCVQSKFTSTGDQYWRSVTLTLTNQCQKAVDFVNTTVTFKNKSALDTAFWGNFSPLPFPDQPLNISSQRQSDGTYLATLNMHFTAHPGANTLLPANKSIEIQYGVKSDTHINQTTQVYE